MASLENTTNEISVNW